MEEEKVVKCRGCGQYFGHTEKKTKCPFCHAEYGKAASSAEASAAKEEKKEATKTQKKIFKSWKNN